MKIDRLMGIVLYLLSHPGATASSLAKRFEVSKRTIQRDIDALDRAGVPIVATYGPEGGYSLMEGFVLDRGLLDAKDLRHLSVALRGMESALGNGEAGATARKLLTRTETMSEPLSIDLSVARENERVQRWLPVVEDAIEQGTVLRIKYIDVKQTETQRYIEPLSLEYRWYSWYLLAYCRRREAFRMFKLERVAACVATEDTFDPQAYGDTEALFAQHMDHDTRHYLDIRLICQAAAWEPVMEFFNGSVVEEFENGDFLYEMSLPEEERMWFSLLLGLGDMVEVIEPESLRERLRAMAEAVSRMYSRKVT